MAEQIFSAKIGGMHCAACSTRIEKVVGNLQGVTACSVNLATEKAKIVYDPTSLTVAAIAEKIVDLGFQMEAAGEVEDSEQAGEESTVRLAAMRKRLLPAFFLALAVMGLSMAHMLGIPLPRFLDAEQSPFIHALCQFLLVLPVLYLGRSFFISGIPALVRGGPNMDSLIAIGTGAAFIYSTWTAHISPKTPKCSRVKQQ